MATFVEFVPTLRDSEPACEFNERLLYAPPSRPGLVHFFTQLFCNRLG